MANLHLTLIRRLWALSVALRSLLYALVLLPLLAAVGQVVVPLTDVRLPDEESKMENKKKPNKIKNTI